MGVGEIAPNLLGMASTLSRVDRVTLSMLLTAYERSKTVCA